MTITIESGHTMPSRKRLEASGTKRDPLSVRGMLRNALAMMREGQSFIWQDSRQAFLAAYDIGATIKTKKLNGKGYRIWRAA